MRLPAGLVTFTDRQQHWARDPNVTWHMTVRFRGRWFWKRSTLPLELNCPHTPVHTAHHVTITKPANHGKRTCESGVTRSCHPARDQSHGSTLWSHGGVTQSPAAPAGRYGKGEQPTGEARARTMTTRDLCPLCNRRQSLSLLVLTHQTRSDPGVPDAACLGRT